MLREAPLLWSLCALTCLTGCTQLHADIKLAVGGQTEYSILVDPEATVAEQHAAEELAAFLEQVTGAQFPVRSGAAVQANPTIVVGPGRAARALAPDLSFDDLRPDGIIIETRDDHLILAGDRPPGTLYAVCTFLEDVVGCRWWSSKASTIPHKPTLTIPEQHVRYVPPLEYRETFWYDGFDPDWAVRNKYNGMRPALDEQRGGKVSYAGWSSPRESSNGWRNTRRRRSSRCPRTTGTATACASSVRPWRRPRDHRPGHYCTSSTTSPSRLASSTLMLR
jgi:hypothetical protein